MKRERRTDVHAPGKDNMTTEPTTLTTANTIAQLPLADALKHRPTSAMDPRVLLAIAAREAGNNTAAGYWSAQAERRDYAAFPPGTTREQAVERVRASGARCDAADLECDPFLAGALVRLLEREVRNTGAYPLATTTSDRSDGEMVWPAGWSRERAVEALTAAGVETAGTGAPITDATDLEILPLVLEALLDGRIPLDAQRADQRDVARAWNEQHLETLGHPRPTTADDVKRAHDEQHLELLREHRERNARKP